MEFKQCFKYWDAIQQLINDYYKQCPGSIMPLFLLYLARTGKPGKELLKIDEKIRKPLDWKDNPERRYSSEILSQFTKEDAAELSRTDLAGANLLQRWQCNEMDHMSIVVFHPAGRIQQIREAFQKHDEALGDSMQKRRALFLFTQGLLQCTPDFLEDRYLYIANLILEHAHLFEGFENLAIARFERWILGDVKGPVFVPFSRAPFAASLLRHASVITESSGPDADMASMVSELILKGNGIKKAQSSVAAKPYATKGDALYDAVILNFAHHSEKTDETSWHYCLKTMKDGLSEKGKYIGLIETKYLFKMVGKQKIFKEIIADNSLESIVLLPRQFGLALISVNRAKKHPKNVKMVNLFNEDLFNEDVDYSPRMLQRIVSYNSKNIPIDVLEREQSTIESFFEEVIPEKEGFRLIPLGKVLRRYRKDSFFGVTDSIKPDDYLIADFNGNKPYDPFHYMAYSRPADTFGLFSPAYYLDTDSLLIKAEGELEPNLYRGDCDPAFFSDGLAFAISQTIWPPYIINELRKPYIKSQLNRWSASKKCLHSEDEILDLKIYIPNCENPYGEEQEICERELNANILPEGEQIEDDKGNYYIIQKCLGKGGFGISYLATHGSFYCFDEEPETVVLKEFFSDFREGSKRFEGNRVAMALGDIESIRKEKDLHSFLVKFIDEAETMKFFSRFPGCRVRSARNIFLCRDTNTYYYEMDFYRQGTLNDVLVNSGPMSEKEFITRVMKPIAIALDTMHNNHWLHLDVKAENILIDDDGYAVLGDLGISHHYDEKGEKTTKGGGVGTVVFSSPLQRKDAFVKTFHPELDVFSFAGLMYYAFTGNDLEHVSAEALDSAYAELSEQSKEAILTALDPTLKTTPKSIREFMHMLPGCENMSFKDLLPVEEEFKQLTRDFEPGDFDDIPDFT